MEEDLRAARYEVAAAARDERRLADQRADAADRAKEMAEKAVLAVERSDDELAREALKRKRAAERLQKSLTEEWEAQKESVDALRAHLQGLELKIAEAKRRHEIIVARKRLAEARRGVHATASHLRDYGDREAFERLSERITDLETEADATAEITAGLVETRFEKLTEDGRQADQELEAELERIKEQVKRRQAGDEPATGGSRRDRRGD
jgi:phage shock protein A